jgi:hypothetical protein
MSDVMTQQGVLGFEGEGRLALPGFSEGFSEGLTLQLWVLLRRGGGQRRILELGGGLFLGEGSQPESLALGVEGPEGEAVLTAPGALPVGRWVQVSATLNAQGHATLYAQGLRLAQGLLRPPGTLGSTGGCLGRGERLKGIRGELSQLSFWRRALKPEALLQPSRGSLRGDEPGLAAYYPLDTLVEGQALELTPNQRHARASGAITCLSGTALAEAMADVPQAVAFSGAASWLQLPPLTPEALRNGLSVQAWIRPRGGSGPVRLLELGAGPGHDALLLGGKDGTDALVIDMRTLPASPQTFGLQEKPRPQTERICQVPGVFVPGRWVHVSAVLEPKEHRCTVFVNGRAVHQASLPKKALASSQIRTHCYLGRYSQDQAVTFAGELAEVRLWKAALSPEQVASTWASRLRGDEAELLACYRLDALEKGLALDASARRVHARAVGGVTMAAADGLPLRSVTRAGQPGVSVQGKLLTDWVPLSLFAPTSKPGGKGWDDIAEAARKPLEQQANAQRYGTIQGSLVRCSLYEILIEPRNAAGEPVGAERVELCLDEAREVLRSEGGRTWLEPWKGRSVHTLGVPESGRLRLCILAGSSLDCPSVRVRREGMPSDAWVVARPADASQEALLTLNGDSMRHPTDGRAPVFGAKTSKGDADAVAELLRSTAQALPVSASKSTGVMRKPAPGVTKSAKLNLDSVDDIAGQVWNGVSGTVESAIEQAERALKEASELLVDTYEDARELVKKAAKVPAQVGAEAARQCIRGARKLVVDTGDALEGTGEAVWGVVQLVGERIVNGSKQVFRVMVSGVTEVLQAIEELALKVGTAIQKVIDYLARLFQWHRFLDNMDRIYDTGLRMLEEADRHTGVLKELPALIDGLVKAPASSEVARKTLGQVVGLNARMGLPDFDELKYLVDQIESGFSGHGFSVENHQPRKRQCPQDVNSASTSDSSKQCMKALPSEMFRPSEGLFAMPMKPLMEAPARVWELARPDCVPLLQWIDREAKSALKDAKTVLTQRLSVPVLTEFIETVVLGGRKMNLLRLVALIGAIPMTLAPSSGKKSTGTTTTKASLESAPKVKEEEEKDTETEKALRYLQFSVSIANAVLSGCRAGAENASGEKAEVAVRILFGVSSAFALLNAGADFYLASQEKKEAARACAYTHASIATAAGVWLGVMAGLWQSGAEGGGNQFLDTLVEVSLGVGEIATSIAEVATKISSPQELGNIGFQVGAWSLRGLQRVFDGCDNSQGSGSGQGGFQYAKALNLATCGAMFVLEAVECGLYAEGKIS